MTVTAHRDAERDPFFRGPRAPFETRAGTVHLPILYYDTSNVLAFFHAPADAAAVLLDGTGLKPAFKLLGRTVVGLSFYEYRHTSVGAYNEVGLAIPAVDAAQRRGPAMLIEPLRPLASRRLGFFVVDLPVTTAIADAAGRELWGYPKFVTGIDFGYAGRHVAMRVADPASATDILRLEGRPSPGLPAPPMSLVTYSMLDGRRVRTTVNVRGRLRVGLGGSVRLAVGDSRHPMAEHLRRLGLDGKRPFLVAGTHRFQSRLNAGESRAAESHDGGP